MTQLITPTMRKPRSVHDYLSYQINYLVREINERPRDTRQAYIVELFTALTQSANNRAAILAALTALARQTDPMEHVNLLAAVLCALQDGGVDVRGLIDCVMAEVG